MKENIIEFYLNRFKFIGSIEGADLSFISPLVRRKLNKLDKVTVSALNNVYSQDVENIVFSSHYGEYERLIKIIDQYKEFKEVSPNTFSGSVHNYPVGFFLLNQQKPVPYNALAFGEGDISSGLLASLVTKYNNSIFCYSDILGDTYISFSLNFSKIRNNESQKYILTIKSSNVKEPSYEEYKCFFENNMKKLVVPFFTIERADYD